MANRLPSITIEGDKELKALLEQIPGTLLRECEQAMKAVAKPIIASARRRLKKGHGIRTGQLKKSLGVRKILKFPYEGKIVMYVGAREGFATVEDNGKKHDPARIAHLVEFGHKMATGGQVQEKPFLRPAIDEHRSKFNTVFMEKIKKILEKRAGK